MAELFEYYSRTWSVLEKAPWYEISDLCEDERVN
ncbi:hypothetical protein PENSOL_c053G10814 [Penicillium solitum]|uniref:Uncharacterized protein n=1 Tax=Penicillium solitum TaxID=60172 RepID=A0A1V6QQH9_9EURO|nr:uncharacterized protein PENSOL_c053G10814 [Penicillium solitum]OQD91479.1 hypothetical protein PENSOL_c053G10814 [Penicillium solitum]